MSDEAEPILLWVRNEQAKVYGPLSPTSVELLIDNGVLAGRLQVSVDGLNFLLPGRLPGPRVVFPKAIWGDVVEEGEAADAAYARIILPPPIPDVGAPPKSAAAKAPAGRAPEAPRATGAVPMAGPAARVASPYRPSASRVQPAGSSPSAVRSSTVTPPPQRPSGTPVASPARRPSRSPSERPTIPPDGPSTPRPGPAPSVPAPAASHPSAVGLPAAGSLAEYSPMRLYGLAAVTDATALLELALNDRSIQVHFKRGAPELIDSSHPHDALPAFLMAQGLATPGQLEEAEAQKERFGGELLPALFGLGLVNPNIVFQQIAERATAILFRALSAEQGTFTFQAKELPAHKSLPLGNRWALYLEQLRRIPAADVRRRMMAFMALPVMRSGGAVSVADLKLQPQEARALQFFDGVRSLNELVGDHPMEADVLVRVAWMLRELDLIAFDGTPAPARAPTDEPPMVPPSVAPSGIRTPPPIPPPSVTARPAGTRRTIPPQGAPPGAPPASSPAMGSVSSAPSSSAPPRVGTPPGAQAAVSPAVGSAPSSSAPPRVVTAPGGPAVVSPAVGSSSSTPRVVAPPGAQPVSPAGGPPSSAAAPRAVAPPGAPSVTAPPGAPPPAQRPLVAKVVPITPAPVAPPMLKATVASSVPGGPVYPPPRQAVPYPERRSPSVPVTPAGGAGRSASPASSASGVVKSPTPPSGVTPTNDVAQLTALLERARKQTYFEVLNLPRETDATAAKVAYFRLAKVFHPDTVPPGSPEAVAKLKADLFAVIGEAHRTLSDPRLKQDYIAEIDSGTVGEKVDVARLLLAEELFQRGRMLVKARKWADAVKVLDEAIDANAQEGEYFGWRGFARFFLHEDKAKGHPLALRDMEYALKLNPNASAIHYFQGYLWKMMGDLSRAKTFFKRCVELDPRHIDAQRELRMMK